MLRSTIPLLAVAWICLAAFSSANAQTNATSASTNSAATNAPSAASPAPVALSDVVNQAQALTAKLQETQASLTTDPTAQATDAALPALTRQIDEHAAEDQDLLKGSPSLSSLQSSQAWWQSLAGNWTATATALSARAKDVDGTLTQLGEWQAQWQATLKSAQQTGAPAEILPRIQAVLAAIADTRRAAQAAQAQIFSVQTRVAEQNTRIKDALGAITKAQDTARNELFTQDHPALWNVEASPHAGADIVAQERTSLQTQIEALKTYLLTKIPAIIIHLMILALLIAGFFWIRAATKSQAEKEAAFSHTARIFDVPVATGVLLALLASVWLYPLAPRLLWACVGAVALIPAVIIIRRLLEPTLLPIFYATVIAYFVDQLRYVLMPAGILSRFLFLFELMAACVVLLMVLRARHLAASGQTDRLKFNARLYLHVTFYVLWLAGFANVFGYVHLGYLLGNGMLQSSYLAVILYAAVRIADALAFAALNIRPLTGFNMVRQHHDLLYRNSSACIRWLALGLWILAVLQIFSIRDPLWQTATHVLTKEHSWGWMTFKLGPILAFPITVWASFLLSRFIRFGLEEEVYPNLQLGRGIPYAASTMVHYTILVLGFFMALDALGVNLTQFSVLAGAFGVGLGFGLQNIMNNFVSGVILLFERPVKVGDVVQVDATTIGTVQRIGIRASVIRLLNGSEYIVPNGNLISNPVTNWTLSDSKRLIEIPVNVTSKVDPQHVLEVLTRVAKANPQVLRNPPPETLLATFGATLSFRVRAWVDSGPEWMKVSSDLSLAINSAMAAENVTLS